MSRIGDLGIKNERLPELIEQYEREFIDVAVNLSMKGKMLEGALKEQCTWPIYYDQRKAELKIILKHLDAQVSKVRGLLVKRYTENYSRQLGERALNAYIDSEPEYLSAHGLYLEVEELYEKYSAAVDAFNRRGFALRDLTLARQHSIHDTLL